MRLITGVPALQAHSALRYGEWREVIGVWVARRLGCGPGDLVPQTVAHAALGTSMAAFLVWVDDPSSDLVTNLGEGYALLGEGLRESTQCSARADASP